MPLQKFTPKKGVNKENSRLFNEGGWWECNRVRFRQGTPQQIGGWTPWSTSKFTGVCRTMKAWSTLAGTTLIGLGTSQKVQIGNGGTFYDASPTRAYQALTTPFAATNGSPVLTVTATAHGASTNDYVTFYGAQALSTQAFTVTVASPGVLTLASALANNTPVILSTTGALPTGLTPGVVYYVKNAAGSTCQLSATIGGAAINTSGTQSGTHSLVVSSALPVTVFNASYPITVVDANHFTITLLSNATAYDTGNGGANVTAVFDATAGSDIAVAQVGWGASTWGSGAWGTGATGSTLMRLWNMANFGQDLILGMRGGSLYYWNANFGPLQLPVVITTGTPGIVTLPFSPYNGMALQLFTTGTMPTGLAMGTVYYAVSSSGLQCGLATTPGGSAIAITGTYTGSIYVSQRAIPLTQFNGASDVPLVHNLLLVSDSTRFVFCFGVNTLGTSQIDPMYIRWSDQESAVMWTPLQTNQAGGIRLSRGSKIMAALQTRQEILVWTDQALYSMQYLGPPYVWGQQMVGDNVSIASANAAANASGITYWMGKDKFYFYNGTIQTLRCDLRSYIYDNINLNQSEQIFACTIEAFDEVWFFYPSANSTQVDSYVTYNYVEDCWTHGSMKRSAWLDARLLGQPIAATYNNTVVYHESGTDDNETGVANPMNSYLLSSEFDIGDGDRFGLVTRVIPDVVFTGSTATNPQISLTLNALNYSGSGYTSPSSQGGTNTGVVQRSVAANIEQYTNELFLRIRARQMSFRVDNTTVGTTWQIGATRIDFRPDGRKN